MTTPTLPAGTFWQARAYKAFTLAINPYMRMLATSFALGPLSVDPQVTMSGGGESVGGFTLTVTPRVHVTELGFELSVTPTLSMPGGSLSVADFDLAVTPALSMAGELFARGDQVNVAVHRASTI